MKKRPDLVIDDGQFIDVYRIDNCPRYPSMFACWVVTNRRSGDHWTMKRYATKQEWINVLTDRGAIPFEQWKKEAK